MVGEGFKTFHPRPDGLPQRQVASKRLRGGVGGRKKNPHGQMVAGFYGTRVCWLVFTEAGRAGWFLPSEDALAGFYAGRVRWLVFIERGCAGWFLSQPGCAGCFSKTH